ncbi:hypothetical protein HJC23_003165 [Cyclotella cryptica]|uniref:CS domain-containing protein n=1 Tax=Cyclotella cryptica TaxID=29204 RepID=A0ABD3PQN1_9STRA
MALTPTMSGDTFRYLLIPADVSLPIQTLTASKCGGLGDDELQKEAKKYFYERSDKEARQAALDQASPEQRKQLADKMREEVQSAAAGQNAAAFAQLDDDALIDIMRTTQNSATCEITALTLPTPLNSYRGVSMYTADDARIQNLPPNPRATDLLTACGHNINAEKQTIGGPPLGGIYGDAFVGRYHDNELQDIWEREDISVEEVEIRQNPLPEWIKAAKLPGGGGSGSGAGENMMNVQTLDQLKEGKEEGYTWSQNDDEVEMRFPIAASAKVKDVKVDFRMKSIKVTVSGQVLLDATLGGDVDPEDSTFTIENGSGGTRELCVTLGKKESYTWRCVATPK